MQRTGATSLLDAAIGVDLRHRFARRQLRTVQRGVLRGERRLENGLRYGRGGFRRVNRRLRRGELDDDDVLWIVARKESDEVGIVSAFHVVAVHRAARSPRLAGEQIVVEG